MAFHEFINQQILQRLDLPKVEQPSIPSVPATAPAPEPATAKPDERIITTEGELRVFNWLKQRLAFLVKDERLFSEIDNIQFRDYQGKFSMFYKMERKGRLLDFYERKSPDGVQNRFIFPDDVGLEKREFVTNDLPALDSAILTTFKTRVSALIRERNE